MRKYACPNCELENVLKFSVAYQKETRQIDVKIYQAGFLGDRWGQRWAKPKVRLSLCRP